MAIKICYEPQAGAEKEVLRTFFTFVGCLVRTTRMSAEDMSKQHKILAHPENKQTAYLFLTDRYPGDAERAENELWCAFSIKEQKLIINGADAIQSRSSVMQFEKEALNDIIRHDYKSGNMSDEQAQATKRAYKRFEDLKRRGYLDGNGSVLYITLKGKEYFYQSTKNAEKVMTGNKRAAQEPQN